MIALALSEGGALKICHVLVKYKEFLRGKNDEINESYTTQKIEDQLLTHYGSKICITNETNEGRFLYSSSINIFEVFELAADYKKCYMTKNFLKITIPGQKCC